MASDLSKRARTGAAATVRGALLSYRALFTWLNPLGYLSSRIARPIGLAVALISLSSYYGAGVSRMIVGASLLAGAGAVIYGMALSTGNERSFGTLGIWLASPQRKLAAACERALPHLLDGIFGALCTYLLCCALFGAMPVPLPAFLGLLTVGVVTMFGFGLMLSALALVIEDLFVAPNVAELVLMVLSGTLIARERLPGWLQPFNDVFPLSRIMTMVDGHMAGRGWDASVLIGEVAVGVCWFVAGSMSMHAAARYATGRAGLD